MQLELLPREASHAPTDVLEAWYTRSGRREEGRTDLAEVERAAVEFLTTPCDVVVYRRPLVSSSRLRANASR